MKTKKKRNKTTFFLSCSTCLLEDRKFNFSIEICNILRTFMYVNIHLCFWFKCEEFNEDTA